MIWIENNKQKWLFFLWGVLVTIIREIRLITEPRFWAEEGTIFYSSAYSNSLWENLCTINVGYYTLLNVLVSHFSILFPTELAPVITTVVGLFIQLLPLVIIVFYPSIWWDTFLKKILIGTLVIVASPAEIWINTTNSHFYLGLITLLILLVDQGKLSNKDRWFFRVLLFLGVLTGPASSLVAPGYLWKSFKEKNRETYIQTSIVVFCVIIQACIIVYAALYNNKYSRFSGFDLSEFLLTYVGDSFGLLMPFGKNDRRVIGLILAPFILWLFYKNIKQTAYQYLILVFFSVSFFSILGSLRMIGGPRYSYVPTIIIFLILIREIFVAANEGRVIKQISLWILVLSTTFLVVFYQKNLEQNVSKKFPKWKDEVELWKRDPLYKPRVHPSNEKDPWEMDLHRKKK
jgi:hypothetical protein